MRIGIILLAVIATHIGYHYASDPDQAAWWFHISRGVECVVLFGFLAYDFHTAGKVMGVLVCLWGLMEESQSAVCGYLWMGDYEVPTWSGMCLKHIGPWPYAITAATALVYLTRKKWTRPA